MSDRADRGRVGCVQFMSPKPVPVLGGEPVKLLRSTQGGGYPIATSQRLLG